MPVLGLEHQSSFAEANNGEGGGAAMNTEPARMNPDELSDEEMKEEQTALQKMFECHVSNLVEFTDRRDIPQRKTQADQMNDIVLYI